MKANYRALILAALTLVVAACQKSPPAGPRPVADVAASAPAASAAPNGDPSIATPPAAENALLAVQPTAPPPAAPPPPAETPPPVAAVPEPAPKSVVIPAGTRLSIKLDAALGSNSSAAGESFSGTLVKDIRVQGAEVIAARASVVGKVIEAKAAGKFAGASSLGIRLESLSDHAISTDTYSQHVDGKGKRSALIIGGSAVAGALLGGLAGHGKGALIGGAAGGGLGTLGAAETGNSHDIILPEGTIVTFRLRRSLTLN